MTTSNSSIPEGVPLRPLLLLAFAAAIILLYTSASFENGFIYDDHEVILNQPIPDSLADIASLFGERHFPTLPYYRPVTRMSFMLQKMLHGDSTVLFHAANALLIGLTFILAYSVLRLPRLQIAPVPALLAALLFAVHPIASACVYPVASGRETLLPALLTLACVATFFHGSRKSYWTGVACFAAALFSKEQAAFLPLLLLWGDFLGLSPNSPGRCPRVWVVRYLPLVPIVTCYMVIRWYLFQGSEIQLAIDESPAGPFWSFGYAFQTILTPFSSLIYEPSIDVWFSWGRLLVAVMLLLILGLLCSHHAQQLKTPLAFFGFWFGLSLLPTANLLEQEAKFAERYVFLALLAVLGIFAAVMSASWKHLRIRGTLVTTSVVLVLLSSFVSWHRGAFYKNELTFFRQWVSTNPASANAHVHLGLAWRRTGRLDLAVKSFQSALAAESNFSGAHINLANVLFEQARFDDALFHYRSGLDGLADNEQRAGVLYNMGNVYLVQKRLVEARKQYALAVELNPELYDGYIILGNIDRQENRFRQAVQHYRRALQRVPEGTPLSRQIRQLIRHCERRE